MTDYIDKKAAIDIAADAWSESENETAEQIWVRLRALPSADVEHVVRCKDCVFGYKYFDVVNGITNSWVDCRNPDGLNRFVSCDGHCSAGRMP